MDAYFIFSVVAIAIATLSALIELVSIRHIDKRLAKESQKFEERGSFGEQLNDWLFAKDEEEGETNLETVVGLIGQKFYASVSHAFAGQRSGEARLQKNVDRRVFDGLIASDGDLALAKMALEKLGLGDLVTPELLPHAAKALQKWNIFGNQGVSTLKKGELGKF